MTFTALKARIAGETGLDTSTDDTVLGVWANLAYKSILGAFRWPWLLKNGAIQTVTEITTGTVSINAGATSGTFSSGPAVSVALQYMIQFPTVSDDWYTIATHTAASTSFTIANAFVGTSNLSAGTYILRKVYYSLPSDLDGIIGIRQTISDIDLTPVDIRMFDRYLPDPSNSADPVVFALAGFDSSKNWQITVYPIPASVLNLQIRYYYTPSDMSSGSDTPVLPEKFHDTIVFLALMNYGHPYIDDDRYKLAKDRYDQMMLDMKNNYDPLPEQFHVIQTWDSRPRRTSGALRWPSNYPEYWR